MEGSATQSTGPLPETSLRVKLLAKSSGPDPEASWKRMLPNGDPRVNRCQFVFDPACRDYDWLVVYDDLPGSKGERFTLSSETLACPRERTLLITTEPASIKVYGTGYLRQFGWILTSQEPWVIRHPRPIFRQPGLVWFYGKSHQECAAFSPENKSKNLSTVCSSKRQRHTLHRLRHGFTWKLKREIPELEIYGHGVRPLKVKADALDPYRYHLSIENHLAEHHWTEKLADAFLGMALPFYYGCPNIEAYFPRESFIRIDLKDFDGTVEKIRKAITENAYEKSLPSLREARRLVLGEYNLFQQLAKLIEERTPSNLELPPMGNQAIHPEILSRHLWRRRHPLGSLGYLLERIRVSRKLKRKDAQPAEPN